MYRERVPPARSLTGWLPRLLVAGSFTLGANAADDYKPAWSPDYAHLVFTRIKSDSGAIPGACGTGAYQLPSGAYGDQPA
jgi:hypothetical protein